MSSDSRSAIADDLVAMAAAPSVPFTLPDINVYVRDVNGHIGRLLASIAQIPTTLPWVDLTPERFRERTSVLPPRQRIGAFWTDQSHQALIYTALTAWKARSLTWSLIRSLNSSELIAPAVLARSLLELATATHQHLREAIGVFEHVAASNNPVIAETAQSLRLEETLQKGIWGTRIGTSKLADKSPLWSSSPYPDEPLLATNILTSFQAIAQGAPELGGTAFKVYEWLCDLVHPATQGLRLFWEEPDKSVQGERRFTVRADGGPSKVTIDAIVLWGVGYSVVLLDNTIRRLTTAIAGVQSRLESVYQMKRITRSDS